jgi:Uma2 family endonuclease
MFLTESINQKFNQEDQILILTGATWADYEAMDSPEYNRYLISYLNGQITIMSPGRNHERIAEIIKILIIAYCRKFQIACFPFGSTRLKKTGLEGKEPDCGYAFITDKNNPDLAVEVNFTSGNISDLTKYQYLKLKEVWIWQNKTIKFYILEQDSYIETDTSLNLVNIQSNQIIDFINRGLSNDVIEIEKNWLEVLSRIGNK